MGDYSEFAALEKTGWSDAATAQSYADGFAEAAAMCAPALVAAVGVRRGSRALDLCTGHGIVAAALNLAGADVVALDFSPAMLALARSRVSGVEFLEGEAMDLSFENGRFDAVTIGFGIPHVPDPVHVFAEARRVLRTGGRFAYSVWCGPEVEGAFGWVFRAIQQHGDPSVSLPPGPDATVFGTPDVAFPALKAAGFDEMHAETVPSVWVNDDPATPYNFFYDGAVRGAALLRPQPEENKRAIRQDVIDQVRSNCGSGAGLNIPMPAVVVSATAS